MDQETQTYYDNYFSLFANRRLEATYESDFTNNANKINSIEATKDADDMYFRKGQLNVLAHLINMETIVTTNYEEASKTEEND